MTRYEMLTLDLIRAANSAKPFADTEDGGTCNFDSMTLSLPRWKREKVKDAVSRAGLRCWAHSAWGAIEYVISVPVARQANARTRQAEAMRASMKERGYDAGMYYQMD